MRYKNNPLNIRHTKNLWNGEDTPENGFCRFTDIIFGIRAGLYLFLKSYRKHNCFTVRQCIERFAPRKENDTDSYLAYVNKFCNVDFYVHSLSVIQLYHLFVAMCKIESQYNLPFDIFYKAKSKL